MSIKVYSFPNLDEINKYQVFKTSSTNKERNFNEKYQNYYLGKDCLNLSKDCNYQHDYKLSYHKNKSRSYSNIIKFLCFLSLFLVLLIGFFSVLIALGGLYFTIILLIIFLTVVLMWSINLNPLDKKTYKKIGIF